MKRRRESYYYLAVLFTGGYFGLVWVYLMNRDIQRVDDAHFPELQQFAALGAAGYGASLLVLSTAAQDYPVLFSPVAIVVGFSSAVLLLVLLLRGIFAIAEYVRGQGGQPPENAALLYLSFLLFVSLPILQRRLKEVSLREQGFQA